MVTTTPMGPASLLRLHPAVQVFCDRTAAGMGGEGAPKD